MAVHSVLRRVDRAGGREEAGEAGVVAAVVAEASRALHIPRTRRIFRSGPGVYRSPEVPPPLL